MKLYYSKGACSLVVRIILNEIGLNAAYESVDLRSKKTETGQDFLTINPKGSVPVLQLDNGQILTENAVILQYIADTEKKAQLLPAIPSFTRYRVLEWLNYITTELHKSFGPLFNPSIPQQLRDEILIPQIKSKLGFIDNHLKDNAYLAGEHFSLPDAYLFVMLLWTRHFKMDLKTWDHLTSYFTKLGSRKSVIESMKQENIGQ